MIIYDMDSSMHILVYFAQNTNSKKMENYFYGVVLQVSILIYCF